MGDEVCDVDKAGLDGFPECETMNGNGNPVIGGLRDPTVYEYDFMPINAGFAGACVVAFYQLFYNIYLGELFTN